MSVVQANKGQDVQWGLMVGSPPCFEILPSTVSRGWGVLPGPQSQNNSFLMLCLYNLVVKPDDFMAGNTALFLWGCKIRPLGTLYSLMGGVHWVFQAKDSSIPRKSSHVYLLNYLHGLVSPCRTSHASDTLCDEN